jgi:tyrosine-protein kinase Etk/Wzc
MGRLPVWLGGLFLMFIRTPGQYNMKTQTENYPSDINEPIFLRAINSIRRRFKIVLLIFLLSVLSAWFYIAIQKPVYQAMATLDLSRAVEQGQSPEDIVEILKSRSLANQVVRQMNLDWQVASLSQGFDVKVGRFLVSRDIPGLRIVLDELPLYKVFDLGGRFVGEGRSDEAFRSNEIDLLLEIRKGKAGDQLTIEHRPNLVDVEELMSSITVVHRIGDGHIIKIISSGGDPEQTRDLANALVETYRAQRLLEKDQSLLEIEEQITETRVALAAVSEELHEFSQKAGFAGLPSGTDTLSDKLAQLEQEQTQLKGQRLKFERAFVQLQQSISDGSVFLPPAFNEFPHIVEVSRRLAELRTRQKELLIEFTSAHPDVGEIQDAIDETQGNLLGRYTAVINELNTVIQDLDIRIAESSARIDSLPEAEFLRLEQQRSTQMEILTSLQQKQQALQLEKALVADQVRVVDPAVTPRKPVWPDKRKVLAVGSASGLVLGFLAAFLLSLADRRFNTVEEIQAKLKLPIYGVIPRIPDVDVEPGVPVAVQMPKAPVVEAFRALRTRLHSVTHKEKHKIILVTSSMPGEGKSTTSTNLAVVLAQTRAKVLLIGCDLRRPSLHDMFGQTNVPGLVDLLSEKRQDAIRHIASPRIDFLPAGSIPLNPSEILDSRRMRNFLDMVRNRYDYVVIDAPPVLPVTDAQILSPLADITLAVIEPCRVPEKAAMQMVDALHSVGASISGMVINDRMGRGFRYYGSYSYYGNKNYSGYYGENPDDLADGPITRTAKKIWAKLNY